MIVVTLACVLLGGRIEYLRRRAEYHEREATSWYHHDWDTFENVTQATAAAAKQEGEAMAFLHHSSLAEKYRHAIYRPWIIVDESEFPVPDYPAPTPNQPHK